VQQGDIYQLGMMCHTLFVDLNPIVTLPYWDEHRDVVLHQLSQTQELHVILDGVIGVGEFEIN